MSAMIVQCPSCEVRFHLRQDRVPEKGARVRCSRCEHRFFVQRDGTTRELSDSSGKLSESGSTTATGKSLADTRDRTPPSQSESRKLAAGAGDTAKPASGGPPPLSRPASRPAARAKPTPAATPARGAPASDASGRAKRPSVPLSDEPGDTPSGRSPWSNRAAPDPEEDRSLENPEFLYEPPTETAGSRHAFIAHAAPDDDPSAGDDPPIPPARGQTATIAIDPPPAASAPDDDAIPDIRAQRDEMAAQRALAALDTAERDGDGEPDDTTGTLSARARLGAVSDLSADPDPGPSLADSTAGTGRGRSEVPQPPAGAPLDLGDDLDGDAGLGGDIGSWTPEPRRPATGSRATPTSYAANSAAVHVPSAPATLAVDPPEEPTHAAARGEPIQSSKASLALAWAAGLALILGAGRQLAGHMAAVLPPSPAALAAASIDVGAGWTATEVATTRIQDAEGSLFVIEGRLTEGSGTPPRLRASLLDAHGAPVGVSPVTLAGRVAAHTRTPDALRSLLSGGAGAETPLARAAIETDAGWFTVLAPDPPPNVAAFALTIAP